MSYTEFYRVLGIVHFSRKMANFMAEHVTAMKL